MVLDDECPGSGPGWPRPQMPPQNIMGYMHSLRHFLFVKIKLNKKKHKLLLHFFSFKNRILRFSIMIACCQACILTSRSSRYGFCSMSIHEYIMSM